MPVASRVGSIAETSQSPAYDYGKQITCTRTYVGTLAECLANVVRQGVLGTGDMSGFIVDGSTVNGIGGGNYQLAIKYLAYGSTVDLPNDEYSVDPFEINPKLEKHPRYADLETSLIEQVRSIVDAASPDTRAQAYSLLETQALANVDGNAARALELADALIRGQDAFYLPGLKYIWATHHPVDGVPNLSLGGTIETPTGPCAPYLPPGSQWLREADKLAWTGTVWKVTRTWVGAPTGHWNTNIYPAG